MASKTPLTYRDAGVDIDAGNALVERIKPEVARTMRSEVIGGLGGFGGLFHLANKYQDPVLVSGTDGVGTKLLLAQQHDQLDGIGIDLVAMCVNDILVCGAEPLFFLDYFACGRLDVNQASRVIAGIARGCELAGCALIGGETAEMPDMYPDAKFDLAGFSVGAIERQDMLTGDQIALGDQLIAIASSGPHSNGYSLIRRIVERDPDALNQAVDDHTVLDALLAPTRVYVKPILSMLRAHRSMIRGMAHITGGGLTENIVRVIPQSLGIDIDVSTWAMPEIFCWLMETGHVSIDEMRRTFNLGVGYVIIAHPDQAEQIIRDLDQQHQLKAWIMGEVVRPANEHRVRFSHG